MLTHIWLRHVTVFESCGVAVFFLHSRSFWLLSSREIILSLFFSGHFIPQSDIILFKSGERKPEKPRKFEKGTLVAVTQPLVGLRFFFHSGS